MARDYRMKKRAEVFEETRERILQATMQLHDIHGVANTSFTQIAERAGVGAATVYRHFPTAGELVRACGAHVWQEMRPPTPDAAAEVFAGLETTDARLERLVAETDAFYARGALRLALAGRDRDLVPELEAFLGAVEAGVEALVREALRLAAPPEPAMQVVIGLMSFPVWSTFARLKIPPGDLPGFKLRMIACGMAAAVPAK